MKNHKQKPPASAALPVDNGRLTPNELLEFQLRSKQLQDATHTRMMVEESYQAWVARTLVAHGFKGQYAIDLSSGEIKPRG